MAITPETNIKLLKVPLEISNKHQINFESKEEQYNYFNSLEKIEIDEANYQRKDNVLMFPAHIDSILEYNYLMYQNSNYGNKWFYAFITHMEYENNGTTKIYITTDVFQTWWFNLDFKESFIEREMVKLSLDVPGYNRVPEGLEFGEMIVNAPYEISGLNAYQVLAYSNNVVPQKVDGTSDIAVGTTSNIDNLSSPVGFIVCTTSEDFRKLNQAINNAGYGDFIISAFTIPSFCVDSQINQYRKIGTDYTAYSLTGNHFNTDKKTIEITPYRLFQNYRPRNQKLLQYPYCYLGFNAPNGSSKIYKYENFIASFPTFKIASEVNPNPTVLFIPQNYNGDTNDNFQDMAAVQGYPLLSTRSDYFNSWLAQNSSIIDLNMRQEAYNYQVDVLRTGLGGTANIFAKAFKMDTSVLSDAATMGLDLASLDVNHEYYVQQQMAQIEKQALLPDKVNMNSTNTTILNYDTTQTGLKCFFYRFTIRRDFAERIDSFFDMYGYLTNKIKKPNLTNRPCWNYVKTIGANIIAEIPQEDLEAIKLLFDNGITIWHNPEHFLDYSQNNR